jgi:hypothetical protein
MRIYNRKISELIPADYNPRQLTEKEHGDIKASLKKFGFIDPVIVNQHKDRKNIIVGGHQRCIVWKGLGNDTVPCVYVELEYERERELNVRLNKNLGGWDYDKLANLFDVEALKEWGFSDYDLSFAVRADTYSDDFSLENKDAPGFSQMVFSLSSEQIEIITKLLKHVKYNLLTEKDLVDNENTNGAALFYIVESWGKQKKLL